jgi:hypothetical protein
VYEELTVSDGVEVWIKDFQDSDAPQFKGKSKEKRREMAVAAYMSAKETLDEATQQPKTGTLTIVQILSKELAPYLTEMKKRYRDSGKQFVTTTEKNLKEHDWDLNKLVPRMKNIYDRKAYIEYQRYKQKIQTITTPDKDKNPIVLRFDGPYYLQMAPGKIEAFLKSMEKDAEESFDSYIAKLAQKIGQEIKSADVQGNLWNGSVLEVVTLANEVQRWKTQIIINRSKLGLLFNQYPTRLMK